MKRIARNLVVLAVFAMALTGFVLAQQSDYRVLANIPFDFYAGNQHFDAGTYLFVVNYGDHAVILQNQRTGSRSVILAIPGDSTRSGEAVVDFDLIGGAYSLADVATRSDGVHFHEREARLASAQRGGTVTIAAVLR